MRRIQFFWGALRAKQLRVYTLLKAELDNNTIELESVLNEKIDYNRLADSLLVGMQNHFNIEFVSVSNPDIITTYIQTESI